MREAAQCIECDGKDLLAITFNGYWCNDCGNITMYDSAGKQAIYYKHRMSDQLFESKAEVERWVKENGQPVKITEIQTDGLGTVGVGSEIKLKPRNSAMITDAGRGGRSGLQERENKAYPHLCKTGEPHKWMKNNRELWFECTICGAKNSLG